MDPTETIVSRMAFGLAADLAEARDHRLAGRLHNALGAGGEVPEITAEVLRRLDIAPELAALVREAVEDALAGRRPRW